MQKKSIGKQLWEIFSPLVLKFAIEFVVETILISIYFVQYMPELMKVAGSQEELAEKLTEVISGVYQYAVEITAIAALVTIPFLVLMVRRDSLKEKAAGILQNRKAPLLKYVLVAGISIPFSVALNNIITLSDLAEYSVAYQEAAESLYTPSLSVQILCLGIIIPITEEYVFRGLVYKRMRRNTSAVNAIIFSAVFFGGYHMNMVQAIYGALCGLLLGYLYEKYGSIKAPILAHMLMNIATCILTGVDAFTWMFSQPMRMAVITIACAALAATMFVLIQKIEEKPEVIEEQAVSEG